MGRDHGVRRASLALAALAAGLAAPLLDAHGAAAGIDSATLALSSPTIVPGQTVYATVTADLPGNYPANNVQAHFTSSGDVVFPNGSGCSTNTHGQCSVAMHAGGGYMAQTVTVDVTGIGYSATASAPLTEYDSPTTMSLSLSPGSMQADGVSPTTATASLSDAAGRAVAGEPLSLSSNDAGVAIGPVKDNGDGTYTSRVVAPPPNTAAAGGTFTDTVTATATLASLSASAALALTNPTPRIVGPLSVSGNQVLDGAGHPISLKGAAAVSWYASTTDTKTLTAATIGNLYHWGATYVRVMMSSDLYVQSCSNVVYPPGYVDAFNRAVNTITSFGMIAVLDMHLSNPLCQQPASNGQYGQPLPLPSVADAQNLFSRLTAAFTGNPLVAYELYNEPFVCADSPTGTNDTSSYPNGCASHADANQAWVNGGTLTLPNAAGSYPAAGMKTIYDDVRAGAPNSVVFVDANGFASDNSSFDAICQNGTASTCLWQNPTNLVYVFHYYDCQETSSGTATCQDGTPETCKTITGRIDWMLQDHANGGAAWPAPVNFDEFGWPQGESKYQYPSTTIDGITVNSTFTAYNHGLFINNVIATLDAHGVGWNVFAYGNQQYGVPVWQGAYALVQSADTVPWTPNQDGQPAVNSMQGQALTCTDPPAGDG